MVSEVGVYLGEDAEGIAAAEKQARAKLALYAGGMGPRDNNFYNELAIRYGYEAEAKEIQDAFLGGDKRAAAAAGKVKDRIAAYRPHLTRNVRGCGRYSDQIRGRKGWY